MILPLEVLEAEAAFWSEYLVGFFIDSYAPYQHVRDHIMRSGILCVVEYYA